MTFLNKIKSFIKVSFVFAVGTTLVNAQTDNPCGAPLLTVNTNCSFSAGTIPASATDTPGIPAPGCASYSGSDVWYTATVPANGSLSIDMNSGSFTDAGMAWYSAASCSGPFTLMECDDDGSNNGLMSKITQSGLTPGQVIFIRVWRYSGGTGTFEICASSPPPPTPCIGGGNNACNVAQGFCTNNPVTYCNISSPNLGSYDCLGSTPNAMWLYMEISGAGNLNIDIAQFDNSGNPIDVDFALYGPYTSVPVGCPNIGPATATVDCSYSGSATEQANISNAQVGQVYILLVTNFNGAAGSIDFSNASGTTGQTDCNVINPCSVTSSQTPATCGQNTGTVTATPGNGVAPYTFSWNSPGNPTTATVNNLAPGTYTVTMTTDDGCVAISDVTVADEIATYTSITTPATCAGFTDGSATINTTNSFGTITYLWDDPAGQTTQTATNLGPGTYTCTVSTSAGCSNIVTVTVSELPGLTAAIVNQSDVTCNSGNDGLIQLSISQGTPPYTYVWDNSSSTTEIANDLMVGPHMVTVTDQNGCFVQLSSVLNEPSPLTITSITPPTQICPEDNIDLVAIGAGGSSQYTYTWYENGDFIGTGNTINIDSISSNTQYCVELSEACGSPTVQECTIITFHTPIQPMAIVDEFEKCVPDTFYFQNTSINGADIVTTFWEFGDNPTHTEITNGNDSIAHFYDVVGTYSVTMTVTSIYGCVYSSTMNNIIEVKPIPTANFSFSNNPATYFQTSTTMQDASSSDVVYWSWYSPGSVPAASNSENPTFVFPEGETGSYPVTLTVETALGCVDTLQLMMTIIDEILFYAPNAFTPDGDQHNQVWKPIISGIDVYAFELLIYNRWGELIWENHDPSQGWDGTYNGTLVPAGSYAWIARVKKPQNDGKETFSGNINMFR